MEDVYAMIEANSNALLTWSNPDLLPADAITKDWFGAEASHAVFIAAGYLAFVLVASLVMMGMNPIDVSRMKYFYNPLQVILCSWMMIEAARQAYRTGEGTVLGLTFNHKRSGIADVLWVFYISKILDFLDTVFIIFSKKWKQLSFLHVYHHTTIFLMYWLNLRAGYDGDIYITIVLNAFVHLVMYLYYMITTLRLSVITKKGKNPNQNEYGPYRPSWKWIVTFIQMFQFITMNLQACWILLTEGAQYPRNITIIYLVYIQTLFWLFFNFARKAYCGGGKKKKQNKHKKQKKQK